MPRPLEVPQYDNRYASQTGAVTQLHSHKASLNIDVNCKRGSDATFGIFDNFDVGSSKNISVRHSSQELPPGLTGFKKNQPMGVVAKNKRDLWISYRGHERGSPTFRKKPRSAKMSEILARRPRSLRVRLGKVSSV